MSSISNLGYMCVAARDLDAWAHFATAILGAVCERPADDTLLVRLDELEYRLQILRGEDDDLAVAGWAVDTVPELEDFIASLRDRGLAVHEASSEDRTTRMVERLYWCFDPDGLRHEFFTGARHAPMSRAFASPLLVGGGFETGRLGVGHFLQNARDPAATVTFYQQILDLKISDYIKEKDYLPGLDVQGTFIRARTGRHHSVAVTSMPMPKRVHHIMVQLKCLEDVGLCLDRCLDAGLFIEHSLGQHPNDRMTSFYVRTPSGFSIEIGCGAIVVPDDDWEIKTFSELSSWGHHLSDNPNS